MALLTPGILTASAKIRGKEDRWTQLKQSCWTKGVQVAKIGPRL